jgi:hypothetical protein
MKNTFDLEPRGNGRGLELDIKSMDVRWSPEIIHTNTPDWRARCEVLASAKRVFELRGIRKHEQLAFCFRLSRENHVKSILNKDSAKFFPMAA